MWSVHHLIYEIYGVFVSNTCYTTFCSSLDIFSNGLPETDEGSSYSHAIEFSDYKCTFQKSDTKCKLWYLWLTFCVWLWYDMLPSNLTFSFPVSLLFVLFNFKPTKAPVIPTPPPSAPPSKAPTPYVSQVCYIIMRYIYLETQICFDSILNPTAAHSRPYTWCKLSHIICLSSFI